MTSSDGHGESGQRTENAGRRESEQPRSRTAAEWITLAISIALILGMVGLVAYVYLSGGNRPPIVEATPLKREIRHEGSAYFLPVRAVNRGDQTAQDVIVRAELDTGEGTPETAEFTIDFLAGGEATEGTVVFSTDPLAGDLTVKVASFR